MAALEDKIVQRATVAVLNSIYEEEFLGFSYGFRPGRNQHQALDALAFGIGKRRINWVLDADIRVLRRSQSKLASVLTLTLDIRLGRGIRYAKRLPPFNPLEGDTLELPVF